MTRMVPKVGREVAHARTSRCGRPRVMVCVVNVLFLQFVVWTLAGWIQRGQQSTIDYLVEENRVLREQLGKRRVRLSDDQRRRLAVRAKALGRAALRDVAGIVIPDTLLRWYRNLVSPNLASFEKLVDEPTLVGVSGLRVDLARNDELEAWELLEEREQPCVAEIDQDVRVGDDNARQSVHGYSSSGSETPTSSVPSRPVSSSSEEMSVFETFIMPANSSNLVRVISSRR
jgi:hypothetical protein